MWRCEQSNLIRLISFLPNLTQPTGQRSPLEHRVYIPIRRSGLLVTALVGPVNELAKLHSVKPGNYLDGRPGAGMPFWYVTNFFRHLSLLPSTAGTTRIVNSGKGAVAVLLELGG